MREGEKSHTLHCADLPLPPGKHGWRFLESEWNIKGMSKANQFLLTLDLLPWLEDRSHFASTHYFWSQAACDTKCADAQGTDLGPIRGLKKQLSEKV